jgi:NAD(P)-dependent dehydrogenase (short-subunit alcohol dehydrogenase family)
MPVAGRLCVVTGANTGIGRVIATELAARGAHVVLACRSRERTAPVVAQIKAATKNEQARGCRRKVTARGGWGRNPCQRLGRNPAAS